MLLYRIEAIFIKFIFSGYVIERANPNINVFIVQTSRHAHICVYMSADHLYTFDHTECIIDNQ